MTHSDFGNSCVEGLIYLFIILCFFILNHFLCSASTDHFILSIRALISLETRTDDREVVVVSSFRYCNSRIVIKSACNRSLRVVDNESYYEG